jgi:hypothetical protein
MPGDMREEDLAVIPFLRTVKLALDEPEKVKAEDWNILKKGVVKTGKAFSALARSSKITTGIPGIISADVDFEKTANILKGDGSIGDDRDTIYYHVTGFLEKALQELRKKDPDYRIVIFIDDLDRCDPQKALEVLESIKGFFDLEGIVYVIGMDSETINSLIKKKYGEEYTNKGLDYLQKIVQLPFQIPTWKEVDISRSISKIISKGLEGSTLAAEFEKYKDLAVRAIKLNPREVKRFINNIILAKSVFNKPIDELIVIRALDFRRDWNNFLDLITPDTNREGFFKAYKELKEEGRSINNSDELNQYIKEITEKGNPQSTTIFEIYQELIKQGRDLSNFLDAGADDILLRMKKMEEYRRALVAVAYTSIEGDHSIFTHYLLEGLKDDKGSVDASGNVTPHSLGKYIYDKLPEKKTKAKTNN